MEVHDSRTLPIEVHRNCMLRTRTTSHHNLSRKVIFVVTLVIDWSSQLQLQYIDLWYDAPQLHDMHSLFGHFIQYEIHQPASPKLPHCFDDHPRLKRAARMRTSLVPAVTEGSEWLMV